jgi:galactan endo-1,6-beta-galactosidase
MLLKAKARGANLLELFSNSPMWWMCYNHNPSGADNSANDNLQSWNYQQHTVYLATVAKYAQDHWGITFDSVEPFNEPMANWWNATGTQEGCHFDASTQATVLGHLRTELNNRGLTSMKVAASDESLYDQATSTWNSFSSATKALVDRVNVHGYQKGGGRRDLLYAAVAGKRLWNSEYGESDGSGVSLASNLNLDFRWLHPTAWCYWQPFDSGGWGLIQSNPGDNWIGNANPKYYVLAHYTRHIRPGMTIVDGGEGNTVAAYDAAARLLVIVTMNYGAAQTITYNLSNCFNATGPVRRWVTMTGSGSKYARLSDAAVNEKVFAAYFATNTIQTFEVQNVDIQAPLRIEISRGSSEGTILLSWPEWATAYQLYGTTNLALPTSWSRVNQPPTVSNGNFNVLMSTTNSRSQFYRLSNL